MFSKLFANQSKTIVGLQKPLIMPFQQRQFTRAFRKVVLTDDVPNLGFKGEVCFVKPGRAMNFLVPRKQALFFSDPDSKQFINTVDVSKTLKYSYFCHLQTQILEKKQQERRLEVFLSKLKQIKIMFDREVSEINKNVAKLPLESSEVLDQLNKRYNMGI